MLQINDFRKRDEYKLGSLCVGKFFIFDGTLYRRVFWTASTFKRAEWSPECFICMRMTDGELVAINADAMVEYIPDKVIELSMED